ncbi:succinylglutamate desuccinylase/aspartoacylase family protein [Leeia oryzae]|uniref:succinylglutamate desuccinylase/aspartoacylase family protein n=1 Tax=Leeia oryzae TaxID=356662 RepID=UPI000364275C|nr:succinylglutamate desuccinylase/aspartoacylase family protein [Leeia oryzae]
MEQKNHPLLSDTPGTQRQVTSYHFGQPGLGLKVYVQAGLHADELPGQLVSWHLIEQLQQAEQQGAIRGEIIVVPSANPIGLSQGLLHGGVGRFEINSGQNFNRHYPDLYSQIADALANKLGQDAKANQRIIREAMQAALNAKPPVTELDALRHTLMSLAFDADIVLDLHCDLEAVVHLYTTPSGEVKAAALSRHIGAQLLLLAEDSGGQSFDEACNIPWDRLQQRYGQQFPLPEGCFATTVELRGQADVYDDVASADATGLMGWFREIGVIEGHAAQGSHPAPLSTPLAGAEDIIAPMGGILAFKANPGDVLSPGDIIADLVNPATGERVTIKTSNSGMLYSRENNRFVRKGSTIAMVTGMEIKRSGYLLSA